MSGASFPRRGGDNGDWRAYFQKQLERLEQLTTGSDSWTAHKPSCDLIRIARRIATDAERSGVYVSLISATSEGGIQLKWQNTTAEFSIFLYPDFTADFLYLTHDREKRDAGDLRDLEHAGEIVSRYFPR